MSRLGAFIVPAGIVNRDSVIPEGAGAWGPLESDLDVHVLFIDVKQVAQDHVALGLVEPDNSLGHGAVDEEGLPSRGWMHADDRVDALDALGTGGWVVAVDVLMGRRVDGFTAVDDLAEFRGELGVCRVAAGPEGVTSKGWDGIVVQMGDARRMLLVDEITVPSRSATWVSERCTSLGCLKGWPDDGYTLYAWDVWHLRMDLHLAKMLSQLLLLLRREILISEENNGPLGNEQGQLVLLLIREVLQLQPHNLRANVAGQVDDLLGSTEQRALRLVRSGSGIYVWAIDISDLGGILKI